MNAESFVQYVKQLSMLYQLPYEELKSLSMEYPYFQNLHMLLALKSKLEDHYDYKKNLARASAYSVDRAKLYRTLSQLEQLAKTENFLLHEEFLELQEISQVEEKLKELTIIPEVQESTIDLSALQLTPAQDFLPNPSLPTEIPKPTHNTTTEKTLSLSSENGLYMDTIADCTAVAKCIYAFHRKQTKKKIIIPSPSLDIEKKKKELKNYLRKMNQKKPKPMPKQSFSTWVEQFQPAHVKPHLNDLMEAKQREKRQKQLSASTEPEKIASDTFNFFAEKSIQKNSAMVSETLAELLVAQMQYRKAIKAYEQLSLIFPKKSAFFAEKIENLKKLIS